MSSFYSVSLCNAHPTVPTPSLITFLSTSNPGQADELTQRRHPSGEDVCHVKSGKGNKESSKLLEEMSVHVPEDRIAGVLTFSNHV